MTACVESVALVWSGRVKRAPSWFVRYRYETMHGPIPSGYHVHHVCRNSKCVNPEHLRALSARDHAAQHRTNPRSRRRIYNIGH